MSQRDARLIGGIYRIGQVVNTKGILITCTATNRNTNDMVGLFIIELPSTSHPQAVLQLLQPLEQRRSLQSVHVLHVHDWGIDGSRAYIATDPPRGVTLQHVFDNEDINLDRALDLTKQITQGLRALHKHNIAGMDLRPQFITVDTEGVTDRVQIDDIGLHALLSNLGYMNNLHNDDISVLDPRYAPPEYITNGQVGPWSDIYQIGLLLFALITGRLPFVGRNNAETGILQSNEPTPQMSKYKHDAPTQLQEIVDKALAKNPAMRFASADALLNALESVHQSSRPLQHAGQPSIALTREMLSLQEDVSVRAPGEASSKAGPVRGVPSEAGVYAYLCYEENGVETQRIPITKQNVVVGRLDPKRGLSPDIDLSSLDPRMTISRQHARIRFEEAFFYIEDLKSRNKTRLGQLTLTPLQAELLQHGDDVRFGSVQMRFKVPGMTDPPLLKKGK